MDIFFSFSLDILVISTPSSSFFEIHFVQYQQVLSSYVSPFQTPSIYQFAFMTFSILVLVSHLSTHKQIQLWLMLSVDSVHSSNQLLCVHQHGFFWLFLSIDGFVFDIHFESNNFAHEDVYFVAHCLF